MRATLEFTGTLAGQIWMPSTHAWKDVREKVSRDDRPFTLHLEPGGSVRDLLLRVMTGHGGDFQSCAFMDATLRVSRSRVKGGRVVATTTRYLDLRLAADVADLFVPEEEREDWECRIADSFTPEED